MYDWMLAGCLAVTMVTAEGGSWQAGLSKGPGSQVIERCGDAVGFTIRTPVARYRNLRPLKAAGGLRQFQAGDGTVLRVDAKGQIADVTVRTPGVFTQRFVVIGQSTLGEVLKRYGTPTASRQAGAELVVEYATEGVAFLFGNPAGRALSSAQLGERVRGVTVRSKVPDAAGRTVPCTR